MNNAVLGKIMENMEKHRDINLPLQKEKGIIYYQNQIIKLEGFSQNIY